MRNSRKIISLLLTVVMVMGTVTIASADMAFSDLSTSHWGYSYVQTLVGDGTINGYTDGTFRPEANVTRAEFVKMIGKTDKAFASPFADITGHWAYDYIMYSNMDVSGTNFYPDVPITRDDVIGLLWKRAGSPAVSAPSIITNQSSKPGAAAWAYAYGIMNGDDGITMRLDDGVTRAEAAALICRSRTIDTASGKKSVVNTLKPGILETVYESLCAFDDEYDPSRTFTNGEIAGIAMRLAYDTKIPKFQNLNTGISVNRANSFAFYTACQYIWGADRMTEEFYDATANNLDTVALMTFVADFKSGNFGVKNVKEVYYDDVKTVATDNMKTFVYGAYANGIRIDNSNNIYPENAITAENLALILLQLDSLAGFCSTYNITLEKITSSDVSMKTEFAEYPRSADKYPVILKDVPNQVYSSDFIDSKGVVRSEYAKVMYELARSRPDVFTDFLLKITDALNKFGADAELVFIPSMVVETDSEYVIKVMVKIDSVEEGKCFDDIFPNIISGEKPELTAGMSFYAGLATGSKIAGLSIDIDDAVFTSIDYIN